MNANGGGNTISAVADTDIYLQGTSGNADAVYVNADVFEAATAGGYSSGVSLASGTQANIWGSLNTISTGQGDTLQVIGSGNTISGRR